MSIFPAIHVFPSDDSLTLETGPSLIEHPPFILGVVMLLPMWLFVMWMWVTDAPFPEGTFVPVTASTTLLVFAIYGVLTAPISVRAVFSRSPERIEVTTRSIARAKTKVILPQPGKPGFEIDYAHSRLAVLGPGRWKRAVFLTGPFWRSSDHDWLSETRRLT